MSFNRKFTIGFAALAAIVLGPASVAHAQVCRHIGTWTLTQQGYVCAGYSPSGNCVWTDDCRKNVE